MFEHYSVADLFANLYKKRKVNLLALLALFALIAVPFTLKAVKKKKRSPISEDLGSQGKLHNRKISRQRTFQSGNQPLKEV